MNTLKTNLKSWEFWVSVAIVALVVSLLTPFLFLPLAMKLKNKFSKSTPLIIVGLGLALCLGAVPTYAGPVADTSPAMLAAHTQQVHGTLATISGDGLAVICLSAATFGVAWFFSRRSRFSIPIAASLAVTVGTLFFPVKTYAASEVERFTKVLILTALRTLDGTNGFIRATGPGGTNWWAELTNGQFVVRHTTALSTGFTGITVISNGNVAATQVWFQGRLTGTNYLGATPGNFN